MTYKELQDDALDKLVYDSTQTTSGPRTRIKRTLNQWHRRILSRPELSKLRDWPPLTFATVVGTARYGLPPVVEQVLQIYDAATNNPKLDMRMPSWLRFDSRADLNQGTPIIYVPFGMTGSVYQPASTGIWAASSAAGDTTQNIRLDGIRTGGYVHSAGPTLLTGTSRVQIGSRTDYIDVEKVFVDATCLGDITIYDAVTAGNTLAVIPIGKTTVRYYTIQLYPVPSSVITYTVQCRKKVQDMTADKDEPLLPEDFHQLLARYAQYEELRDIKKQPELARQILKEEIEPRLADLTDFIINLPDYIVVPDDGRRQLRGSNLGSWYPGGRW